MSWPGQPRKLRIRIMNMRDGTFSTEEVAADSRVYRLFKMMYQKEYAAEKVRFYFTKSEDGSWIDTGRYGALWLFFRKGTKPLLREILAKTPLELSMRLDDPRCLGQDYVYSDHNINFLVVLPYRRRFDRWREKLDGCACAL